jgi:putative redox protein
MTIHAETETPGKLRHVIRIDGHTLHTDVGAALGGDSSAPGPHDLFDASLAACKALTAFVYARSRKIPLEHVEVELERDDTREREGHYTLGVKLRFGGKDLSDADKTKLGEVLTRCPVHKLMTTTEIEIKQTVDLT